MSDLNAFWDRTAESEKPLEKMEKTTADTNLKGNDSENILVETAASAEEWDSLVESSRQSAIYHRHAFIDAIAEESGTRLCPLIVKKNGEPLGFFPVFIKKFGGFRIGFSPPPGVLVPNLGPVLIAAVSHQSDRERMEGEMAETLSNYLERELKLSFIRFTTTWNNGFDVRHYTWRGFKARPVYTYSIDLSNGVDEASKGFKQQLRRLARRAAQYEELRLVEGDIDVYRDIVRLTRSRYREQGEHWAPSDAYLEKVFHALNKGEQRLRCWAVFSGDDLISGLAVPFFGGTAAHWFGAVRYEAPFMGINEWLHRTAMEEAAAAGCHTYDLVGANTERLCRHKSRYNPNLEVYFNVEKRLGLRGAALRVLENDRIKGLLKRMR